MESTSSSLPPPAAAANNPRFDFYQTDTVVNVSVFIKNARQEDMVVEIGDRSLHVKACSQATGSEHVLHIDPLYADVEKANSSFKVLATKIDVTLHKAQPGATWQRLEADPDALASAATPSYSAASTTPSTSAVPAPSLSDSSTTAPPRAAGSTAAPRPRSKWDSFKPEDDNAGEVPEDQADINKFFQRIYADADEDTRRAMIKSYQESGGTTLSTDWSKVGKGKVETKPPDGLEAKPWTQ
jgi:suppressor of G2 allele of SKP1